MSTNDLARALVARPIAHRGLHDRAGGIVENTSSAFEAAIAAGYAIECDVQISADGEAMVFHDHALERLTDGEGDVRSAKADSLRALAIRDSRDRIGSLADLLAQVAGRTPLVVEIKSRFDGDLRLTRRVASAIAGYAGALGLKSFDPNVVAALRMLTPDTPRGIVAESRTDHGEWAILSAELRRSMANLLHFSETKPDFLSWSVNDLPTAAPFLCRAELGLPVMTWTVRTAEQAAAARAYADQMVFEGFRPD